MHLHLEYNPITDTDRPAPEIQVTPQMIEAGLSALFPLDYLQEGKAPEIVEEVFAECCEPLIWRSFLQKPEHTIAQVQAPLH